MHTYIHNARNTVESGKARPYTEEDFLSPHWPDSLARCLSRLKDV
jgi:hypothetical protein